MHALPSLHAVPLLTGVLVQPPWALQASAVQGLLSSQLRPLTAWHEPARQRSPTLHALPSLHAVLSATLAKAHPEQVLPVVGPQVPLTAAPAATEQAWQSLAPPPQAVLQQTLQPTDKIYHQQIYLGTLDGEKPVALFEPGTILRSSPTFSPDGTQVLMYVEEWANMKPGKAGGFEGELKSDRLVVVDVATRKPTTIFDSKKNEGPSGWKWSPDGKRIAYVHRLQTKGLDGPTTVTVSDADGKNSKDVLEVESTTGHTGDPGLTLAWSPDGKRLAYLHQSAKPLDERDPDRRVDSARVVVIDADGKNSKEIYKVDASWLMGFDWK